MSSIYGLNQSLILFVGRPSDSRKGLTLLFEATEILLTLSDLPPFGLWIVGGSAREVSVVSRMISGINALTSLREEGRIFIWGRVENPALSELYSRACITVMPSYREEFGIVAVEAMMCGCPVIAARTGGLQDIVREGKTGALFEPDDASSLAATISGYLRNPELRRLQSVAARERALKLFSRQSALTLITRAYDPHSVSDLDVTEWECRSVDEKQYLSPERLSRLRGLFDQDLSIAKPVGGGRHPVFYIEVAGNRLVAKFFTKRASLQASLFTHSSIPLMERGGSISYLRVIYNKDNPTAPRTCYFEDEPEPLVITEWLEGAQQGSAEEDDLLLHNAIRQCQEYRPLPDCTELAQYMESLERFGKTRDKSTLEAFDEASARLNSRMTGGKIVLCRTHRQVELARFRSLLDRKLWPLSDEIKVRFTQTIDLLLEAQPIVIEKPALAHGDPKPEHLLTSAASEILLVDFEHSKYAVGPVDLSLWFTFTGVRGQPNTSASVLCDRICSQVSSPLERYLCVSWIVAEVIFFSLQRFLTGDRHELSVAQNFLRDLCLTLLNKKIIL